MTEEKLRDKLDKVMAERRTGKQESGPDLPQNSEPAPEPGNPDANAEWRAFYETVKAHVQGLRD
ncbi:hypothetical protein [Paenibacillus sp. NPDC058071]|uniref:hypothetical protein n=1 Tax=Paenibacillus sp. NPDC058071 TaxID=3346326 RepID=UPI0036DA67A2